jgi:hypothetical protein
MAAPQTGMFTMNNHGTTGHQVLIPTRFGTNTNLQTMGQLPTQGSDPSQLIADEGSSQQSNARSVAGPSYQGGTQPPRTNLPLGNYPHITQSFVPATEQTIADSGAS